MCTSCMKEEGMRAQRERSKYGADVKRLTDTQAMFGLGSSVDPGVSDGNRPHCQLGQTSRRF